MSRLSSSLDAAYVATIRLADWMVAHRLLAAGVGGAAVAGLAVLVNRLVLLDFPNSGDEYVYLYQAETMARGRLRNVGLAPAEAFAFNYLVQRDGLAFGSFPFGWPLALALATVLGLPIWLLTPLLGGVTVVLVGWLGWRLYDGRVAMLAALTVGLSPFVLFNAASYFSHTFCGALLLGAAVLAARRDRSPVWVPMGVGFLIGWAVVARYFTGVVCGVPIGVWLLRRDGRQQGPDVATLLTFVALGGLPWVAGLMVYNAELSGDPLRLTTLPMTVSLWFRDRFISRGGDILANQVLRHVLWTPPILVWLYAYFLRAAPASTRRWPFDWMLLAMAGILYFYSERGGNQYGPRFHYEAFLFAAIFVTANVFRHERLEGQPRRDRVVFGLLAASVLMLPISFAVHAVVERHVIVERTDLYTQVAEKGIAGALVLVGERVGSWRSMPPEDFTRNGVEPQEAPVLYGLDRDPAENCALSARYPGWALYIYTWDVASGTGRMAEYDCLLGRSKE